MDYQGFVRVIDADTLELYIGGNQVGVGLIGISGAPGNSTCGQQAVALNRQLTKGGLWLAEDPNYTFDARHRRMYYALTRDGRSMAQELVKAGLAQPDGTGKETAVLQQLDNAASQNAIGCIHGPAGRLSPAIHRPERLAPRASAPRPMATTSGTAVATVPGGFSQQLVTGGLSNATGFAFLPDGRILIAEKHGIVRVFKNGALLGTPLIDISSIVNDYWDHGLLGIAVDPQFTTNGYIYLLYVYENDPTQYSSSKTSRLSRFTVSGDTASLSSESTVLGTVVGTSCDGYPDGTDCLPADNPSHSVGNIKFDSAGNMFVTNGDASSFNIVDDNALRAQNLDVLNGKLLHVTTSGAGLSANPFWNGSASANRSKVWAYGLRNSYRFNIRPGTAIPFLGDVGWNTWEEINVGNPGVNMGWPCYEGAAQQSGYAPKTVCQSLYSQGASAVAMPLYTYNHNGAGAAATGGMFYTGTTYPSIYQGAYFFGDYALSKINYMAVDGNNGLVSGPSDFLFGADGPVDIEMGPDQALYYLAISAGELRKVVYTGQPDLAPTVSAVTPADTSTGAAVTTNVTASFSEALQSSSVTTADFFVVQQGGSTPLPATVTYDGKSSTATLTLTNNLQTNTTYVATVKGGSAGVTDLSGTPMVSDKTWTFTTASLTPPPAGTSFLSDLTYYYMTNGWGPVETDMSNGEQAAGDGHPLSIRGVQYAKGLGAHDASDVRYYLGGNCSSFSATVGVDDEVAPNGSVIFQVFGDGTKLYDSGVMTGTMAGAGASVNVSGVNQLQLVVTDDGDGINYDHADWANAQVSCGLGGPPVTKVLSPAPTLTYKVGGTVSYSGSGTDYQGQAIPASGLSWQINIHHCPGGVCHIHYGFIVNTGSTACAAYQSGVCYNSFVVPDHGDSSFFEIILTATDSRGQSSSASVNINPQTVQLTIATSPPGLQVNYGGTNYTAPFTATPAVGSTETIYAPSPQGSNAFTSWSDGGAQQHNIVTGSANTTYTATFGTGTTPPPAVNVYLSDLTWNSMTNGYGPAERDMSNGDVGAGDGLPISIRGITYAKGIGAHAASDIHIPLGAGCTSFSAVVGTDDEVAPNGSVAFQVFGDGRKLFDSGVLTGAMAGVNAAADITGVSDLELVVTDGGDGITSDHADWANAQVSCTAPPTGTPYVSALNWTYMTNGWGPVEKDMSNGEQAAGDGRTISIRGTQYPKGLGAHASSEVRYILGGACSLFTATVGTDDEVAPNGSVVFQVWSLNNKLYDSGLLTGTSAGAPVSVDVSGKAELRLVITDGGDGITSDHGDWANAQLKCP